MTALDATLRSSAASLPQAFVKLDPVPLTVLTEYFGGHLVMRGKSGHYVPPWVVTQMMLNQPPEPAKDLVVQVPTANPDLPDAGETARYYLRHREQRLDQVRAALDQLGPDPAPRRVVEIVYADVDESLWPAADQSVAMRTPRTTPSRCRPRKPGHSAGASAGTTAADAGAAGAPVAVRLLAGAPAGAVSAARAGTAVSRSVDALALLAVATPVLVAAYVSRTVFGVQLRVLPVAGVTAGWTGYVLPVLSLAALSTGYLALLLKGELLVALKAPYTAAAPAMSHFMSSMPWAGLIEMPPVSKQMPLPTSASGASVPSLPCQRITAT